MCLFVIISSHHSLKVSFSLTYVLGYLRLRFKKKFFRPLSDRRSGPLPNWQKTVRIQFATPLDWQKNRTPPNWDPSVLAKYVPSGLAKPRPLRIGTPPDRQKKQDPSELRPLRVGKYDPSGLIKTGPLKIGTPPDWQKTGVFRIGTPPYRQNKTLLDWQIRVARDHSDTVSEPIMQNQLIRKGSTCLQTPPD